MVMLLTARLKENKRIYDLTVEWAVGEMSSIRTRLVLIRWMRDIYLLQ